MYSFLQSQSHLHIKHIRQQGEPSIAAHTFFVLAPIFDNELDIVRISNAESICQ